MTGTMWRYKAAMWEMPKTVKCHTIELQQYDTNISNYPNRLYRILSGGSG